MRHRSDVLMVLFWEPGKRTLPTGIAHWSTWVIFHSNCLHKFSLRSVFSLLSSSTAATEPRRPTGLLRGIGSVGRGCSCSCLLPWPNLSPIPPSPFSQPETLPCHLRGSGCWQIDPEGVSCCHKSGSCCNSPYCSFVMAIAQCPNPFLFSSAVLFSWKDYPFSPRKVCIGFLPYCIGFQWFI